MNSKSIVKNTLVAFAAQGTSLLVSILQSLVIPKVMGVESYGYWQLFFFYTSYAGFFHFGLNDGVYLIKGGESREQIDKRSVNSQLLVSLVYQSCIALAIVALALSGYFGEDRSFVIFCTAIYLVIHNCASYYMFVLQAMNETKLSSFAVMVERAVYVLPFIALLLTGQGDYKPYIISFLCSNCAQLAFCLWHTRDFTHCGTSPLSGAVKEAKESIRVGIKLMLGGIASQLILGIARFTIDSTWGIEVFGELSLSLSVASFFLAFVSQVSMVLFPAMRQSNREDVMSFLGATRSFTDVAFPLMYFAYFPLILMLSAWLPSFARGMTFFAAILPLILYDSKTNLIYYTYFKVYRREDLILKTNALACLICAILVGISLVTVHSYYAVIGIAVVVVVLRSVCYEYYISREMESDAGITPLWLVTLSVVFVVLCYTLPIQWSFLCMCGAYGVYLWLNRSALLQSLSLIRRILFHD